MIHVRSDRASWALALLLAAALLFVSAAINAAETSATTVAAAGPAASPAAAAGTAPAKADDKALADKGNKPAEGAAKPADAPAASLDTRIQQVKADVIALNRDLLVLEEELLFPGNTQVAVFVSMDVGTLFSLESVQVRLDDKVVANHLYTPKEVAALHRGGVQRVHLGNLKGGAHELTAFFTGQGPHERDYKRGATLKFDKGTEPKYIELQIRDVKAKLQPEFEVKVWQ